MGGEGGRMEGRTIEHNLPTYQAMACELLSEFRGKQLSKGMHPYNSVIAVTADWEPNPTCSYKHALQAGWKEDGAKVKTARPHLMKSGASPSEAQRRRQRRKGTTAAEPRVRCWRCRVLPH